MRECINAHTELLKIFENFSHCQKFFAFEKLGNFSLMFKPHKTYLLLTPSLQLLVESAPVR